MKYKIEKGGKPAYLQIYNQIKRDIVNNAYAFNSKLPSKRVLSEEFGVSVITIEHAYDLLVQEGYVESKAKSGYYVVYRKDDFLSQSFDEKEILQPDLEKLENANDFAFPFSVLSKTMRKVMLDYGQSLLNKSHHKGINSFRKAISSYLKRSVDINASPEQIVVGAGAEYLYSLIIQLLGEDKIYAIENPSYSKIEKVYLANQINLETIRLGCKRNKNSTA